MITRFERKDTGMSRSDSGSLFPQQFDMNEVYFS